MRDSGATGLRTTKGRYDMAGSVIAIIFDFDNTLGPDTISFLLTEYGIRPDDFWAEINKDVRNGYDPPQAYMKRILRYVQEEGVMRDLTEERLRELGSKLPLYPGLPGAFIEARKSISSSRVTDLRNAGVGLEFYIISGGLEEMIRGTTLAEHMDGIFGCNFDYDLCTHLPVAIKSTISFTEKTRYVFAINKGLSEEAARTEPYRVNDGIPDEDRRIPLKNMIYVGDGPSDIPCFSLIRKNGGLGIGVSPATETFRKGYELAEGERTTVGPYTADYRKGTDMRKMLRQAVLEKGLEIVIERKRRVVSAPSHS